VAWYGDVIAHKTGLGGVWTGLVLLALVTSLPEVFTGVSAITLVDAPDLTIGDLIGSNAINLLVLAFLDIAYRNGSLLRAVSPTHRLTGWFSLVLALVVAGSIFVSSRFTDMGMAWVGWYTPVIVGLYFVFVRQIFRVEQRQPDLQVAGREKVSINFAIAAALLIAAAIWLAIVGEEIATVTGWGQSFVGTLLIAFTTSLPEITVSSTAMMMGAVDLAVANMIGSNLFNMTVIPIDDLLYRQGPVLAAVSPSHLVTALAVMVMTGIFIAGFRFRPRRYFRLSWWNCALIAVFIIGTYFNFALR